MSVALNDNEYIIVEALKEIGGKATVRELNAFLWRPANQVKYQRHGRAWSEHFCQRDLHYCMKKGVVIGMRDGSHCGRYIYYLAEQIIVNSK